MLVRNRELLHTDAKDRRDFDALSIGEKIEEVWLDGRERNGHMFDMMERLAEIEPMVQRHDRYFYVMFAVMALLIAAWPFVVFVLGQVW